MQTLRQSPEEGTPFLPLEEKSTSTAVGTQKTNSTTSLNSILTPRNGTILTFITTSQDGTTAPLWLRQSPRGNISFLEEKRETSQKEAPDTSATASTPLAFWISRPCTGLPFQQKMETLTTSLYFLPLENILPWPTIRNNLGYWFSVGGTMVGSTTCTP